MKHTKLSYSKMRSTIISVLMIVFLISMNTVGICAAGDRERSALLVEGESFNTALKSLPYFDTYKEIVFCDQAPTDSNELDIKSDISIDRAEWAGYFGYLQVYSKGFTIYIVCDTGIQVNTDMSKMFKDMKNIEYIDISYLSNSTWTWKHYNYVDISELFLGCDNLKTIIVGNDLFTEGISEDTICSDMTSYAYKDQNGVVYPAGTFPVDNSEPLTLRRLDDINVDVSTGQSQNASVQVFANIPSTYAVTLPKRVDIGSVDSFEIYAKGDITENETLTIDVPDTSILSEEGGVIAHDDITLYYETSKSSFAYTDLGSEYQSMNGNDVSSVYIDHDPIPAGHWRSQVPITISLTQGKQRFSIPDVVDTFPYLQRDTASNIIEIFDIYMSPNTTDSN